MQHWRVTTLAAAVIVAVVVGLLGAAHAGTGEESSAPVAAARMALRPAKYPLRVGPTGRYLVDKDARPFLIVGDSPQALIVNVSLADAKRYFANRRASGFNSLWVNLLCTTYTAGRGDATTYDGIAPFTKPGDLATPNQRYFRRADAMLKLAARYGLLIFLDPIETGGWLGVLREQGTARAYAYGKWLGKRYRSFPNIVWFHGNDFQSWNDRRDDRLVLAVAKGIRSVDRNHLHTVELNYRSSGSRDDSRWDGIVRLDAAYTYLPTYAQVLKEYNRPNHMPVFMVEANYELEHDYRSPETLRRQEYWTLLSGASGQLYGHKLVWQLAKGWKSALNTTGVRQFGYVTRLFSGLPWFDLVPDQDHSVVTSGYGTFSQDGTVNDNDYATTAMTRDRTLVISYLPTPRSITVDLSRLAGARASARWYDPSSGRYAAISGSPFATDGARSFAPPGPNHEGAGDWVLVLRTTARSAR